MPTVHRSVLLAAVLLLGMVLPGCRTPLPPAADTVGEDGRFAIRIEPGSIWKLEREGEGSDQLTLVGRIHRPILIVSFRRMTIDPAEPGATAADVALDFALREKEVMVSEGVYRNEYILGPIERDFETVNGHDFFRMRYEVRSAAAANRASLLFYFDSWEKPRELLVIWAGVSDRSSASMDDPLSYPEIREVVESLETPKVRRQAAAAGVAHIAEVRVDQGERIAKLGPFDVERRIEIYRVLGELATELSRQYPYEVLARIPSSGAEVQLGRVELADRDLDGIADEYVIRAADGSDTPDQGFLFDLDDDGRFDCVVSQGGAWQSIDANGDGVEDARAMPADRDGDGAADPGVAAWLLDTDLDGRFDRGDYLGPGVREAIPERGGRFEIRAPWGALWVDREAEQGPFFIATDLSGLE